MVKIPQRFHQWRAVELFIKTATFWAFKVSTVAQCDLIYWRTLDDPMLMSRFREWFVWDRAKKTKSIDVSTAGSQHRDRRPPLKLNRARAELLAPHVQKTEILTSGSVPLRSAVAWPDVTVLRKPWSLVGLSVIRVTFFQGLLLAELYARPSDTKLLFIYQSRSLSKQTQIYGNRLCDPWTAKCWFNLLFWVPSH